MTVEKRKLTVKDFLLMGEMDVFAPDERVELLDGEIYTMSPPSSKHAAWVDRIMKALESSVGDRTIIRRAKPGWAFRTRYPRAGRSRACTQGGLLRNRTAGGK